MYIYFPSCNFTRIFPDTAKRIRAYMEAQPDVRVVGCCKVSTAEPKEGDTIVTVCMSCMRLLDEMRSDIPNISLFEFLLTRNDVNWPDHSGEDIALQDCFRARGKREMQDAVRECLSRMNYDVTEVQPARDEADFDGSFLLHDPYPSNRKLAPKYFDGYLPSHVTPLPEEEWQAVFKKRAERVPCENAVGYCNTCVTALKDAGKNAKHLAELIFV